MTERMEMIESCRGFGEPVKTVYRWLDEVLVSAICYFPDKTRLPSEDAAEAREWYEGDR